MKKTLMLTAFALAGLAAAQTAPATTAPATAPMTTTSTVTGTTAGDAMMTPATLSASDNFARAQEYAVQADVAYPAPFYDRTLWKAAVDHSYFAATQEAGNRDYNAYLAQLYTKTQWWINAYNAWNRLGDLNETEKQWASLSAAKLAYIALQRGDRAAARTYVEKGLSWADSASLQAIRSRL
ncbi:hypothetical protein [Deinococcus wulumuqiensis]|uniref:Tetratricopeptide repeat protein n=2 Tax=Deinococcus wulumuqiensis TaxID=980427 RepID=A0AAV4JZM9_9DEIO|nr:hypothetical protein [Deinococcus wulumuqiensis]QII19731.1 hypothetical protein G6R31_02415 [Deinococcus wulumuqiensis R12]GGI71284.1 hypothetical protein GCM10010914_01670 [Deinococcus wulumuqiensis]GGP28442.1 hypothetical protein GCM10008021_00930 [Deinococcus wulumuqiensis]